MENTSTQEQPLYNGAAKVINVTTTKLRFTDGLTDTEINESFLVRLTVKPEKDGYPNAFIDLEFSAREGRGNNAGKKQFEISIDTATKAELTSGGLEELLDCVGKNVNITQKRNDKGYVNSYLVTGAAPIEKADVLARYKMLTGGSAPAQSAPSANPFD